MCFSGHPISTLHTLLLFLCTPHILLLSTLVIKKLSKMQLYGKTTDLDGTVGRELGTGWVRSHHTDHQHNDYVTAFYVACWMPFEDWCYTVWLLVNSRFLLNDYQIPILLKNSFNIPTTHVMQWFLSGFCFVCTKVRNLISYWRSNQICLLVGRFSWLHAIPKLMRWTAGRQSSRACRVLVYLTFLCRFSKHAF